MNALNIIRPYRWEGTWVFDDPEMNLVREPFVSGADSMMDLLASSLDGAERCFRLIFSAEPFPGFTHSLTWKREEQGGNWYYSEHFKIEGWLCPALLKYFDTAPHAIFLKAEALIKP